MLTDTLDDVFPDELDVVPAGDDHERHRQYLDRCRRVRPGPAVDVVFENARTLRFRLDELARFARTAGADRVSREVGWYRSLLPGAARLLASVHVRDRGLPPPDGQEAVYLRAGDRLVPGSFLAPTAGDRILGRTRWAEFHFAPADLAALADPARPAVLGYAAAGTRSESPPLDPAVRASLLADLGRPDAN